MEQRQVKQQHPLVHMLRLDVKLDALRAQQKRKKKDNVWKEGKNKGKWQTGRKA